MSKRTFFLLNTLLILSLILNICLAIAANKPSKKDFGIDADDLIANDNDNETAGFPAANFGFGGLLGKGLGKMGKGKSFSKSSSFSYSYSSENGKQPKSRVRKMSTEEYIDKEQGKPAQIRKYGELLKKDNDDPALLKKRAATNVEREGMILGDGKEERLLSDKEFKVKLIVYLFFMKLFFCVLNFFAFFI